MIYDVAIIGGGASGVAAAIFLGNANIRTLIIEQEKELVKKVKKTGNGRCNFTNSYYDEDSYRGSKELADSAIKAFNYEDSIKFFNSLGVHVRDVDGYYYPYTNRADTITSAMINGLSDKVDVIIDRIVLKLEDKGDYYHIKTSYKDFDAKKVIVATGGKAGYFFKNNDEQGYNLLKDLGHSITKLQPALTEVYLKAFSNAADFSGIRIRGSVSLVDDISKSAKGEIQLTKKGISGIPVFQISRYLDVNSAVKVNLLAFETEKETVDFLDNSSCKGDRSVYSMLIGLFDERLVKGLIDDDIKELKYGSLTYEEKLEIIANFNFIDRVSGLAGFDKAQVTKGGVKADEIDGLSFKSKLARDVYVIGEALDVDGTCGGYNLQFAFSSAFVAANDIIKELL
ncbi:MAG: aminoacetone oxidase family FAD-binding enzyme [Lachnospiraceae bacterium]|nr:aminoacetone oxidase family FAD-binding enzyme [Lachnospiraceae bacterium]